MIRLSLFSPAQLIKATLAVDKVVAVGTGPVDTRTGEYLANKITSCQAELSLPSLTPAWYVNPLKRPTGGARSEGLDGHLV